MAQLAVGGFLPSPIFSLTTLQHQLWQETSSYTQVCVLHLSSDGKTKMPYAWILHPLWFSASLVSRLLAPAPPISSDPNPRCSKFHPRSSPGQLQWNHCSDVCHFWYMHTLVSVNAHSSLYPSIRCIAFPFLSNFAACFFSKTKDLHVLSWLFFLLVSQWLQRWPSYQCSLAAHLKDAEKGKTRNDILDLLEAHELIHTHIKNNE